MALYRPNYELQAQIKRAKLAISKLPEAVRSDVEAYIESITESSETKSKRIEEYQEVFDKIARFTGAGRGPLVVR